MSICYYGILWSKCSIFVRFGFHGYAHSRKLFNKHILPLLHGTAEELTEAHSLFQLSTANNQVMPVSKYFEADLSLLGFNIPSFGFWWLKIQILFFNPNTVPNYRE